MNRQKSQLWGFLSFSEANNTLYRNSKMKDFSIRSARISHDLHNVVNPLPCSSGTGLSHLIPFGEIPITVPIFQWYLNIQNTSYSTISFQSILPP